MVLSIRPSAAPLARALRASGQLWFSTLAAARSIASRCELEQIRYLLSKPLIRLEQHNLVLPSPGFTKFLFLRGLLDLLPLRGDAGLEHGEECFLLFPRRGLQGFELFDDPRKHGADAEISIHRIDSGRE